MKNFLFEYLLIGVLVATIFVALATPFAPALGVLFVVVVTISALVLRLDTRAHRRRIKEIWS
jgi:uncharacterized membrane protein YdcZ (DUF606 family)